MASEALLRARIGNSIAEDLLRLTREAEQAKLEETHAAIYIQRCWRGFFVRDGLRRCTEAARLVQRFWRGYKGRQKAHRQQLIVAAEMRCRFFDYCATEIQRHWRGFHSRKYTHNFYARKAYLEGVMRRTEALRDEMAKKFEEQMAEVTELEEAQEVKKFQDSLTGKHHLLSTNICGGVFRARYWQFRDAGDAVERKLRSGEERGWVADLGKPGSTLPEPRVLPRYRASIRATEAYNAERERRQVDRAVHRRLLMGGDDFSTAGKSVDLKPITFLHASEPFKEAIRDVVPERSIPRRWVASRAPFKTSFPESKEFDYYDVTMAERPPDPGRMSLYRSPSKEVAAAAGGKKPATGSLSGGSSSTKVLERRDPARRQ